MNVRITIEARKTTASYLGTQTTILAIVQRAEDPSPKDWLQVGLAPRRPYSGKDLVEHLRRLPEPFVVEMPDDIFDIDQRESGVVLVKRAIRAELKSPVDVRDDVQKHERHLGPLDGSPEQNI